MALNGMTNEEKIWTYLKSKNQSKGGNLNVNQNHNRRTARTESH